MLYPGTKMNSYLIRDVWNDDVGMDMKMPLSW